MDVVLVSSGCCMSAVRSPGQAACSSGRAHRVGAPSGQRARTLIARATGALGGFVFGPASLATIIGGIGLAIRGQYGNQLWIQWGMGAVLATVIVGVVVIRPVQAAAVRGEHRGSRLLAFQSLNLVILASAVVVMVFKPTM